MSDAAKNIQYDQGGIVCSFALIESKIQEFITNAYISDMEVGKAFYEEVLEQSFFGFELKKKILLTVLELKYPKFYKTFPKNKLIKLQKLRNIAAHGIIMADKQEDFNKIDRLYFRHGGKNHPAIKLIKEYTSLSQEVLGKILKLPGVASDYLTAQ